MEGKGEGKDLMLFAKKERLREIFERLKSDYIIIAPKVINGAILYDKVDNFDELPFGYRDYQKAGYYRLEKLDTKEFFTYTHPVNSIKSFIHPPELTFMRMEKKETKVKFSYDLPKGKYAFFDVRACDLKSLKILDEVFMDKNIFPDPYYKSLRDDIFVVAVNCTYATDVCFCDTLSSGPEAKEGFDLCLTEIEEGFLVEVGTERGAKLLEGIYLEEADDDKSSKKQEKINSLKVRKEVLPEDLPQRLYSAMEHPFWDEVAKRCLACANCTQVCPTCFCFDILEVNDIDLNRSCRVRVWDSCFSPSFATLHKFNLRESIMSRYRQWLMHKFAYWIDQFGTFGCVGCGRCVTWCPVGIDLLESVKSLLKEE
ncbi:MAG: 4Fe-4S dicluster domain-containing protein [Hydrogenobacter sp.]